MKSIANALHNIASALNSIANEIKMSKNVVPLSKPAITSNPNAGEVNITSYQSNYAEGWYSLTAAQKEQLYLIHKALMEKAVTANHYDSVYDSIMDLLNAKWPSLYKPINTLVAYKEKQVLYKDHASHKDVWKNKFK